MTAPTKSKSDLQLSEKKGKQILARLKVWLLTGKTVTSNQALSMWRTNRIAEYVSRLRKKGFKIKTTMIYDGCDSYGVYSLVRNVRKRK